MTPSIHRRRTPFLRTGAAALAALLVAGTAAAQTFIEPGRTFLLGGEQPQAMRVEGRNTGRVPVDLLVQADGRERRVGTTAPGEAFALDLPARAVAMARNAGTARAELRFRFAGGLGQLSMRYDRP